MELQDYSVGRILVTILLLGFIGFFSRLLDALILKPSRLRSKLRKQGIKGPPPSFLLGNLGDYKKLRFKGSTTTLPQDGEQVITHTCSSVVFPFYDKWIEKYGSTFVFSLGNIPILCVGDPNLVKEMSICTSLDFGKSAFFRKAVDPLLGQGVVNSDGALWAHQRKILAPEFYSDKVKGMMKIVEDSALTVVNSWNTMIDNGGGVADIKIDKYMRNFSGDVIARACFGRNYAEAEEIFLKIGELQQIVMKYAVLQVIPGFRYLPININKKILRFENEVRALILKTVKERRETASSEKDLLQLILESADRNSLEEYASDDFIVDNCKGIYLGGYETTAVSSTWTLMLLALYPEWQDKVRAEVLQICRSEFPNADMLRQMKTLTMVINESLRLYPPFSNVVREAREDMKFGNINVPKGVNIWILVMKLHQDFDIWGPDADKFNPDRFANGVRNACKFPSSYIPFGVGPHTCLGQQLAMVELKMLLALIISNFTFSISPNYRHFPCMNFAIEPEFGVDLVVRRLQK